MEQKNCEIILRRMEPSSFKILAGGYFQDGSYNQNGQSQTTILDMISLSSKKNCCSLKLLCEVATSTFFFFFWHIGEFAHAFLQKQWAYFTPRQKSSFYISFWLRPMHVNCMYLFKRVRYCFRLQCEMLQLHSCQRVTVIVLIIQDLFFIKHTGQHKKKEQPL